jgi:type VI secretion system protein ImpK
MQLIVHIVMLRDSVATRQPDYQQVKTDVLHLVSQSEELCRQWEFNHDDFDQARFMVCAWTDEVLLGSTWHHKQLWQREQLQRHFYNTTDAGVEAFERLKNLALQKRDVREVYYLCLSLGFRGQFIRQGDELLLEQLTTSNLKILLGDPAAIPSLHAVQLFPQAIPVQAAEVPKKQAFAPSPVTAMVLAGPALLFVLLYLIYRVALSGVVEKFS